MAGLLLLLLMSGFQGGPASPDAARKVMADALALVEAGEGPAALAAATRAPADPLGRLRLGTLRVLLYQDDVAEPDLRALAAAEAGPVALEAALRLVASYQRRGRVVEARTMLELASGIATTLADSASLVETELALAAFDIRGGATARAGRRIALADSLAGPDRADLRARVLCQRAAYLSFTGQPGGADEAERGVVLAERAGQRRLAGQCLLTGGSGLIQRGDLDAGANMLARADSLLRDTRDLATLAAVKQWRGFALRLLLRYGEAHETLLEALALAEQSDAGSVRAWTRLNLASIAGALNDFEGARSELALATADFEQQDDQWGRHSSMTALSAMLRRLGLLDSAERVARAVEAWGVAVSAPASVSGARTELVAIAAAREDWRTMAGRLDSLEALYRQAGWTVWQDALANERAVVAIALGDLGGARRHLDAYLRGLRENQPLLRYRARVSLAELEMRSGRLAEGAHELAAAADELDTARRNLPFDQWRRQLLQATNSGLGPDPRMATLIATLAPRLPVQAFELAERRRARELHDRLVRASALSTRPDTLRRWVASGGRLAEFRAALRQTNAAGLVYVTGQGNEPTTAFVVTADSLTVLRLAPVDSLAPAIGRLVAALEAGDAADEVGKSLHRELLAPALERLGGKPARLVIVPEGPLWEVPFSALLDGAGLPLLATTLPVLVPAAETFIELRRRSERVSARGVLALADPSPHQTADPPQGLAALFAMQGATAPLPGARREARRVVRYAEGGVALVGSRATEGALRAADPGSFRVLHFATHALTDGDTPLRAAIALAPDAAGDGFLTAAEIAGLELAADLVVLSSCRSAGGTVLAGEGLQGLTWPLLSAGARSVVASLWDVDDAATARLMTAFYAGMADGLPVVDALGRAQREARDRGVSPSVWAAFTVIGDPLAAPQLREPVPRWWWLGLLALVVGAGAFTWNRRRRREA